MNGELDCSIMCRACMRVDGVLLPMYGDDMISKKNLPDKLADLASIQIDKYDDLPKVLCAKCAYRTDSFHDFKLQVQATEKKLRKMFQYSSDSLASPKAELAQENVTTVNISDVIQVCSEYERNPGYTISSNAENEESKEKQVFPQDDLTLPKTLDLSDEPESGDFTVLENLVEIFSPNSAEPSSPKPEFINDLGEILDSPNYTLLYVNSDKPTLNIPLNESLEESETIVAKSEKLEWNGNEESIDKIDCSENPETDSAATTSKRGQKWPRIIEETVQIENDSDSDDFVEPKDNLLGSLNDSITRIKEIKVDVKTMNFQCTLCMQNYEKLTDVLVHIVKNHVPPEGPYFCIVCEKDCASLRDLRAHVKIHTGRYPYTCFICKKSYSMKRYLKRHMSCHTDLPRHRCPKCGVRFALKGDLENHVREHADKSTAPFACSQCPRVFNHKGNYKRHLISHLDPQGLHLPRYPCETCGKRFLNNRTLRTHVRVHTGEKPYLCEICNKKFSQQGNLINHRRIHSNPRSYTCEVCGKRFNQAATLRDHSLLHTGEKPWVCNVCGIAFTFSAALRRHMWSHADDKPFGCDICDARFVGKYDVKRHMKIHSDRPRNRGKRSVSKKNAVVKDPTMNDAQNENEVQEMIIERVLMDDDTCIIEQDTEKENVDALFTFIQYG